MRFQTCKFLLILFLVPVIRPAAAQLQFQWANNFCCFDSLAIHSFSYPFGYVVDGDTLLLSFFEDGTIHLKKILKTSGTDVQLVTLANDTVESPYYFGGGAIFRNSFVLTAAISINGLTGQSASHIHVRDRNFNPLWNTTIPGWRYISEPVSDLQQNIIMAATGDSVSAVSMTPQGSLNWQTSYFFEGINDGTPPKIFFTSAGIAVLVFEIQDSLTSDNSLGIFRLDASTGTLLDSTRVLSEPGADIVLVQKGDSLIIGWQKNSNHIISLAHLKLSNPSVTSETETNLPPFTKPVELLYDSTDDSMYLLTENSISKFSAADSMLFSAGTGQSMFTEYPRKSLKIFPGGIIAAGQSFYNTSNVPPNADLRLVLLSTQNGSWVDSSLLNSPVNTADIMLSVLTDGIEFYLLYASAFDNISILHEETQLGIASYRFNSTGITGTKHKQEFSIIPNPASDRVHIISSMNDDFFRIKIFDVSGKMLLEKQVDGSETTLSLQNIPPGFYIVTLTSERGRYSGKLVIE